MKIAILSVVILLAAMASAETTIAEHPNRYYVESVGTPGAKPALSGENNVPPAQAAPVADHDSSAPPVTARPITDFDDAPQPVDPVERRASLNKEVQRLKLVRGDLMIRQEGETPEQADRRIQRAQRILRKINKISSELLRMP
jgi:hypothetical protein